MGIRVTDIITTTDSSDTYPTHDALFGLGGFRSVGTVIERDAIPSGRLAVGMWVNVTGDNVYEWDGGSWSVVSISGLSISGASTGVNTNFANTDLTFNDQRTHDIDGKFLIINNTNTGVKPIVYISNDDFSVNNGMLLTDGLYAFGFVTSSNRPYLSLSDSLGKSTLRGEEVSLLSDYVSIDGLSGVGKLRIKDDTTLKYVSFESPTGLSQNVEFILPTGDGISGQSLVTDGSRQLLWDTITGGGGNVQILDEGISLTTSVSSIDFVGDSVTVTNSGNNVTVAIPNLTGSLSLLSDFQYCIVNAESNGIIDNTITTNIGVGYQVVDLSSSITYLQDPFSLANITGHYVEINKTALYKIELNGSFLGGTPTQTSIRNNGNILVSGIGQASAGYASLSVITGLSIGDKVEISQESSSVFDFAGYFIVEEIPDASVILASGDNSLTIYDESSLISSNVTGINFIGSGVAASLTGGIVDVNIPGTNPSFDPLLTHTFGVQQYDWTAMTNQAVVDLTGSSPSQYTTLTGNQTLSFSGTIPSNKDRVYYAHIVPSGFNLILSSGNDPGSFFTQPTYSPFVLAFKVLLDGTPRFAGVI